MALANIFLVNFCKIVFQIPHRREFGGNWGGAWESKPDFLIILSKQ